MGTPLRVLLVEDSEDDAALVVRELTRGGYAVTCRRVETAQAMHAALHGEAWDLVLADYTLPQFSGPAALELLKGTGRDLPFIIVSAMIGEDVAVAAMKAGAHDYVLKRRLARLVPAVERELREAATRRESRHVQESHQRLATAIEQAAESIVITDAQAAILYVNPAFEKVTGYSREEALGQNPRVLKSGKHDGQFYLRMWEALCAGEVWAGRLINRRKDGALFEEEATISPVRDAAGQIVNYVAVKRDVTREVQLESQLRQAMKMEAVGRLAGGVAHDFNNLLTAILGYGDAALRRLRRTDVLYGYLEEIVQAAQRASALTRQLLTFSRKQILQPQLLRPTTLVSDLSKMLHRLIREDIQFSTELASDTCCVKADPGQLEQVIVNLVVNARDAMPGGGRLVIEVANAQLDADQARALGNFAPGSYVRLAVRDTGCGMSEEVQSHLFEPFFTTKPEGRGTGLGLSTTYGIVRQSGGAIRVDSELGRGTTVEIYLPCAMETATAGETATPARPLRRGSETVLLVEDDHGVRRLAQIVLEDEGYTVLEAADGEAAVRILEEHPAPIHLLLSDMVMPGTNGRELAKRLVAMRPELKVLFMSGYSEVMVQQGLDPATTLLPKPFTPHTLVEKVREVLDR